MATRPADIGDEALEARAGIIDISAETLWHRLEETYPGQIELKCFRDGGRVDCYVPFDLIDNEEVAVDEAHALELALQFQQMSADKGGTGQDMAALIGCIDGEPKLKFIDGFHRSAGLRLDGQERVFTTIKHVTWDELYDERIFNAKSHIHVRFSRVVQWIREVWEHSGLSEQLTVEQAILLYEFETPGRRLNLSPETVEAARAWVERKERLWSMSAMNIRNHLKVAEHVDPKLVHATREKVDSHTLTAPTQSILKVFAARLPDRFDVQNVVMQAAMARNLDAPKVKAICTRVKDLTAEQAELSIQRINWDTLESEYGDTTKRALRRAHDPRERGEAVFDRVEDGLDKVSERLRLSVERGEEITDAHKENLRAADSRVRALIGHLGNISIELRNLSGDGSKGDVTRVLGTPPPPAKPPGRRRSPASRPVSVPDETAPELSDLDEPDIDPEDDPYAGDELAKATAVDTDEEDADPGDDPDEGRDASLDWDPEEAEADEEDDDDEPVAPVRPARTSPVRTKSPEGITPQQERFDKDIRAFLTGLADDPPPIKTRLDIQRAEKALAGPLLGDIEYTEVLREEIRQARADQG